MGHKRFKALDGLRGVAIVLVVINHVPLNQWMAESGGILKFVSEILFSSGKAGIAILFTFTGFLMAKLYPEPGSYLKFMAKRYGRLIPLFLVWVISLAMIKYWQVYYWWLAGLIVFGWAAAARKLWDWGAKQKEGVRLVNRLVKGFLSFQLLTALWYVFYLGRIPAPVYYFEWTKSARALTEMWINGTLTLPFGRYIAQLDGVYWALIAELAFYLIYPVLIVPIFGYLKGTSSGGWRAGLLALSVIYCFGLALIFRHLLNFQIVQPVFFAFMILGAALGASFDFWQKKLAGIPRFFHHPLWSVCLLVLIMVLPKAVSPWVPPAYGYVVFLSLLVPVGLLLITSVQEEAQWGRWWGTRGLVFLGMISYAVYLSHATVINFLVKYFPPTSGVQEMGLVLPSLVLSAFVAYGLFRLVEMPYNRLRAAAKKPVPVRRAVPVKVHKSRYIKTVLGLAGVTLVMMLWAFRTPTSLNSVVYKHNPAKVTSLFHGDQVTIIGATPLSKEFTAREANMGMITFHLKGRARENEANISKKPPQLAVRLYNAENQLIAESKYNASDIYEDKFHAFGFPIQADSQGKKYSLEYQLLELDRTRIIELISSGEEFRTVYFNPRSELLSRPALLLHTLGRKLTDPITSVEFRFAALMVAPLLAMLLVTPVVFKKQASRLASS